MTGVLVVLVTVGVTGQFAPEMALGRLAAVIVLTLPGWPAVAVKVSFAVVVMPFAPPVTFEAVKVPEV